MNHWLFLFIIIQIVHYFATWKLYSKAGRKSWEAIIPIYNAVILMKIINRPRWWVILLFVPIVNQIMFPVIWVETIRSFGKNTKRDTWLTILTLGIYICYINYTSDKLIYNSNRDLKPSTKAGDWVSSILFSIIAATIVHTYVIQPFMIPTSSLEKTLLVGDYLFVSKLHYGARVPMTTIAAPMVHDTLPILKTKSYLFSDDYSKKETSLFNKFQFPYIRLPGFQKIKRNEIVVFNQPADTLLDMNNFNPDRNYYKPIDKKTNLVKRCVGIPGDLLEVHDGYVYINGERTKLSNRAKPQYNFFVNTEGKKINQSLLTNRYGVREGLQYKNGKYIMTKEGGYVLTLTDIEAERISNHPFVKSVKKLITQKGTDGGVFPHISSLGWNIDNFGPIYIPEKGKTVKIDQNSLPFYKRIIQEYEKNDLIIKGEEIFINKKKTDNYTFKQDYYWMMGDNRQNSLDARFWGYVPFDHVVGKPVFIWFSWNKLAEGVFDKIRWSRLFTTVKGDKEPTSYFIYFVIVLVMYLGYHGYRKKKKSVF
ncbi:signal peptidase I [Aquimarina sp. RZ0]|uniref:signal peptidase I n=1 Tax=Aquimarina sp. RZ0 TaxID=2607730 RepID=UPI0011F257C2|nr:signal peptidase I [Aquimarina sp. RZ0]KAA1245313.1 signal peptidase I [Aquimarina sp. RZ0]